MTAFRVLVTGSRTWRDPEAVKLALLEAWPEQARQTPLIVVHGRAAGADSYARSWALAMARHGYPVTEEGHRADWDRYPKVAGHVRNEHMVALGADLCLAFPERCEKPECAGRAPHDTHGTAHCIQAARKAGITVRRIEANHG